MPASMRIPYKWTSETAVVHMHTLNMFGRLIEQVKRQLLTAKQRHNF